MATERRADKFTEDAKPSDADPREHRPRLGDERTTLVEALRCQRLTLEMTCAGLDAEALARRAVEPSTMSLLGLVRHLAEAERGTVRVLMAGQTVPRLYCSATPTSCGNGSTVASANSSAQSTPRRRAARSACSGPPIWRRRRSPSMRAMAASAVARRCSGSPSMRLAAHWIQASTSWGTRLW